MEDSPQIARSEKPTSSDADDAVTIRNETDEDVTSDPDSRPPSISPTVFSATTTLRDQSSREPQEVLPSDVIFAFGPSDYYFLYRHQPIGTKIICGPKKGHFSPDTFNSIGRTYAFAFSPHGDEFAAYRDRDTRAITWSFLPSQKLDAPSYQSLRRWLELNVPIHSQAAMLDFKVMFGPGASYFASTFSKCTHHDLPPRLANEIDDRMSRRQAPPDTIALGADGTYFAAWGSRCIWHLDDKSALRQSLRDNTTLAKEFANVYLNPTSKTHYIGVMKDGMITYSAPDTNGKLTGHVKAHMQHMAKHFGRTYVVKFKGSMDTVTSIGPETNFAQVDDELIKEQEKKEKKKEKENQKKKTKAQAEAEEVKEDEENLMSKETEAATMEDTKKGGLLSRVFRRKSVALQ